MPEALAELICNTGWSWPTAGDAVRDDSKLTYSQKFPDGNGANEIEAVWHLEDQVLGNGASITLDLTALTREIFDDTLTTTFLTIRAIEISNLNATSGTIIVGNAATNVWSEPFGADAHTVKVPPNAPLVLASPSVGFDVDASNKNLKIAATGASVTYDIAIIGTTTGTGSGS